MASAPKTARREGFSLIEALVALAIASMTLMAIFELQIQMARGQARAERAVDQVAAQESALALIGALNFTERPQGEATLPRGDRVLWDAVPLTQPRVNVGYGARQGQFEVVLYQVTVSIERQGQPSPAPMVLERMGWRRLDMASLD